MISWLIHDSDVMFLHNLVITCILYLYLASELQMLSGLVNDGDIMFLQTILFCVAVLIN